MTAGMVRPVHDAGKDAEPENMKISSITGDFMQDNTKPERPSEVTLALCLLYLSLVFAMATAVMDFSLLGGKRSDGLAMLVFLPIYVLIYVMIGKGKNWARIAFFVLSVLGILGLVHHFFSGTLDLSWLATAKDSLLLVGAGVDLAALAILFLPVSSDWFKAVAELREAPREGTLTAPLGPDETLWQRIIALLRNTDQPIWSYIWQAWLIGAIPAFVISIIVGIIMPDNMPSFDYESPAGFAVFVVFIGPFVETLLMLPILWILKLTIKKTLWVAGVSAVIWGMMHSTAALAWGFAVAWPFFVFSLCFLEWQSKSTLTAIGVTAILHGCHNLVPTLALALAILGGDMPPQKEVDRATSCPQQIDATISEGNEMPSAGASVHATPIEEAEDLSREDK